MINNTRFSRRGILTNLLAGASALFLSGCDKLSNSFWFSKILETGEKVTYGLVSSPVVPRRRDMIALRDGAQ